MAPKKLDYFEKQLRQDKEVHSRIGTIISKLNADNLFYHVSPDDSKSIANIIVQLKTIQKKYEPPS